MKYFKNKTGEVFGYDSTQQDLIDEAIENKWEDVTGKWPPAQPAPTTEQILAGYQSQIQSRLDTFAQERGYSGILSACTYATSNVEKFAGEGQRCVDLRDATWGNAFEIMQGVEAGGKLPTWAEVEAQLPALTWGE